MTTEPTPAVGDRIRADMQVTRVAKPTFPVGGDLVYAQVVGGGAEEVYVPASARQEAPEGAAYQYLPLTEITDGHVRAFKRAFDAGAAYENATSDDRIRAGLAAIQWPTVEAQAGPEVREIALSSAVAGDRVLIDGYFHGYSTDMTKMFVGTERGATVVEVDLALIDSRPSLNCVTVTRPVLPLPTPGQVAYEAARTERLARRHSDEVIVWDELNDGTRGMWEAAATAVLAIQANDGQDS